MIRLLTRFTACDEATAAEFGERLLRLSTTAPSELNNLFYEVYASADDPKVFFCLESWPTQADVNRHLAKNEADGVNDGIAGMLAAPPETTIIRPL